MRAVSSLHQICKRCLPYIHIVRYRALLAAIEGLIRGGRLSLTGIGRALRSRAHPKHCIKRIDRLLGNALRTMWLAP
jgi:hypothetical protein